jgi:hypothetical protein
MKKPISKDQIRRRLEHQTKAFMDAGGEINAIEPGLSGIDEAITPIRTPVFSKPAESRTPLTDVVKALEERRRAKLKRTPKKVRARTTSRKKQIVYDDFGEPLRVIWRDD